MVFLDRIYRINRIVNLKKRIHTKVLGLKNKIIVQFIRYDADRQRCEDAIELSVASAMTEGFSLKKRARGRTSKGGDP